MERGKAEITVEYTQQKLSSTRNISPFFIKKKNQKLLFNTQKMQKIYYAHYCKELVTVDKTLSLYTLFSVVHNFMD